jgi:hypothetical protein
MLLSERAVVDLVGLSTCDHTSSDFAIGQAHDTSDSAAIDVFDFNSVHVQLTETKSVRTRVKLGLIGLVFWMNRMCCRDAIVAYAQRPHLFFYSADEL